MKRTVIIIIIIIIEFILENETHKILWDFVIQMDQPIPDRRSYILLINKKKKLSSGGFCSSSWSESEKIDKYWDLARGLKKQQNINDEERYCSWRTWNGSQRFGWDWKKKGADCISVED